VTQARLASSVRCALGFGASCALRAQIAAEEGAPDTRDWLLTACFLEHRVSCSQAIRDMERDPGFADWELYDFVAERYEILEGTSTRPGVRAPSAR